MLKIDYIIGLLAGILCAISFMPQLMKAFKTKHTKDLSLITFSILCLGVFLWLIYGILIRQTPIILANAVMLMLASLILALKIRYG